MTPKYKVGQMVRLLPLERTWSPWMKQQGGRITCITAIFGVRRGRFYYTVDIRTPDGTFLAADERYLAPINDPPTKGDWSEITKLLGFDMRKELEHL